jgi:hypothetical protein
MTDKKPEPPDLRQMFATLPTSCTPAFAHEEPGKPGSETDPLTGAPYPSKISMGFVFTETSFGFGEIVIVQTEEGTFIDGETMSREHIKRLLGVLVDSAILDSENDPERHKLYDKVMGRKCGEEPYEK